MQNTSTEPYCVQGAAAVVTAAEGTPEGHGGGKGGNASPGSPSPHGRQMMSKMPTTLKPVAGASRKIRAGKGPDEEWGRGGFCKRLLHPPVTLQMMILRTL